MIHGYRIVLIAMWPALVLAMLAGSRAAGATSGPEGESVRASLNWLAALGGVYLANFAVAWFTRHSWTAALVRSLLWAAVAFVCVSGIADMFAERRDLIDHLFGDAAEAAPETAAMLRWRVGCWLAALGMSVTCIGVGFEPRGGEQREISR